MARLEDVERRLLNWARWVHMQGSDGALGYAEVRLGGDGVGQRAAYREASIPVIECEAAETDQAVKALPGELRATVVTVYTASGTRTDHLRVLHISLSTLKARIGEAHRLMSRYFADRHTAAAVERARVEALQRRR